MYNYFPEIHFFFLHLPKHQKLDKTRSQWIQKFINIVLLNIFASFQSGLYIFCIKIYNCLYKHCFFTNFGFVIYVTVIYVTKQNCQKNPNMVKRPEFCCFFPIRHQPRKSKMKYYLKPQNISFSQKTFRSIALFTWQTIKSFDFYFFSKKTLFWCQFMLLSQKMHTQIPTFNIVICLTIHLDWNL